MATRFYDVREPLQAGFYLELLFWRGSVRVEDDFITIYADAFNQPLPLAETFGGQAQSFGGEASPLPPPVDRTLASDMHSSSLGV